MENEKNSKQDRTTSADQMEALLSNENIIITIVDQNGKITNVSKGCENVIGKKREEILGRDSREIIKGSLLYECALTGKYIENQIEYLNERELVVTCIPMKSGKKLRGAIGIVLYSNIKKMEDTISQLKQVSHELNMYKKHIKDINTAQYSLDSIIGDSKKIKELKGIIRKAAKGNSNVLITGESGTGKGLIE